MKPKIIFTLIITAFITVAASALVLDRKAETQAGQASRADANASANGFAETSRPNEVISAPGSVEPISEEIEVGAEVGGKIRSVRVGEGDKVTRGQTLAVLENNDLQAQIASAQARLSEAEAERQRIINGAREEERREALAGVEQAEAVVRNARIELERRRVLVNDGDIPREEYDRAERDLRVAEARAKEMKERHAHINAAARQEDVARADAAVELARAQIREAEARLEKTIVRAPISGVILRQRRRVGERVSPEMENPALFTIADTSVLRVRVDVDETDVSRIRVGQRAYVKAEAYHERQFWGRVVRVGQVLGRKNIRTDEPAERVDTKILETLVELDGGQNIPPGLRVDAFILTSEKSASAR